MAHAPPVSAALSPGVRAWWLACLGLLSAALYAWIAVRYPLVPGLERGRASWVTLSDGSLAAGLHHAVVYSALMLSYVLALHLLCVAPPTLAQQRWLVGLVVGVWLLCAALLLGTYPAESFDIFDYLFRGRMLAEYGASPLARSPTPFDERPFYRFITWRGQVDTYGPLWEYASWAVAWIVGRLQRAPVQETTATLAHYLLGYRLLAITMSGLCSLFVYNIVRRHQPALAPAALLAWLWNPLLFTTSAVGAHNDLLMLFWMLVGLWLFQRQRWLFGLLALLLAAHVKLTALLLLPVAVLWLLRRAGWQIATVRTGAALALMVPLSWLLYAPLGGWATLPRMLRERTLFLANSPADLVYRALQEQASWAEPAARQLAILGATTLFCILAALLLATMLDLPALFQPQVAFISDAALWHCGIAVTMAYLLVGSFWFMPWYGLWALALVVLLPASRWARLWLPVFCLGALWSGLGAEFLGSWAAVACLYLPLALAGLAQVFLRIAWLKYNNEQRASVSSR